MRSPVMRSGLMMANWPRRILVAVSCFVAAALLAESHRSALAGKPLLRQANPTP